VRKKLATFTFLAGCTLLSVAAAAQEEAPKDKPPANDQQASIQETITNLQKKIDELEQEQKKQAELIEGHRKQLDQSRVELQDRILEVEQGAKSAEAADPNWDKPKAGHTSLINSYYFRFIILGQTGWLNKTDQDDKSSYFDANLPIYLCVYLNAGEHGLLKLKAQWGLGNNLDSQVPTISYFNETYGNSSWLRPTDVWYEHSWLQDRIKFRIGLINMSSIFDQNDIASDETVFFLSQAWDNNTALEFPLFWGLGATFIFKPHEQVRLMAAWTDANGLWNEIFSAPWAIGEIDYTPKPGGLTGNYRFYGWYNGRKHLDMKDPTVTRVNFGFGVSFDQKVNSFTTLSLRYGWQNLQGQLRESADGSAGLGFALIPYANYALYLAVGFSGDRYKRPQDFTGIGYGVSFTGGAWRAAERTGVYPSPNQVGPDPFVPANEHHVEFFYRASLTEFLTITPDLQWVINPLGNTYYNLGVLVFTVRLCLYIPG